MKSYPVWIPALCVCILLIGCEQPQTEAQNGASVDQEGARDAIESQNARFERYIENQQFDSLATLYTAGAQVMAPNAPTASGENLLGIFEGMTQMGIASVNLQTTEVEAADDFAYEVGTYSLQAEGGMEADNGKYIVIWRMEDGDWKIHRDIFNSNVQQQGQGEPADTTGM